MLHFHLSTTPIFSKIRFIIEGLTRIFFVASNSSHYASQQ